MAAPKVEKEGVKKFLNTLNPSVREKVDALRKVQDECNVVRDNLVAEKKALEEKYRKIYEPLFNKRAELVVGSDSAPTEPNGGTGEGIGAVPGFWLRVLKNPDIVGGHVNRRDEAILKYLYDVRSDVIEDGSNGFKLVFKFAENPYFKPLVLEKKYFMGSDDETVLEKTEGTDIEWQEGKNPTYKVVKKKGSKPGEAAGTKVVEKHSFFDFFSPPEVDIEGAQSEEMTEIAELLAEDDFEMGCYIKEYVIPNAVSWYTGEIEDEKDTDEEDEEDDSSDEYSSSDSD